MKNLLKHSKLIIFVCIAITIVSAIPLTKVTIENTYRIFMPRSSDSYQRLMATEDEFGSMITAGVSLETTDETILTPENIAVIQKITEQIENLEGVDSIDSVTNIDYVHSLDGGLAAGDLLDEDYTGSQADMEKIKEKIVDWQDMYNRVIVDDNFKSAQIVASIEPNLATKAQVNLLHKIEEIALTEAEGKNIEVRFYGDPVLSDNATKFMLRDLIVLIPLVALVVLFSLYFSFHTIAGTLLPLITVLMATCWSCGIMAACGITFTLIASVIPVCLIACGSAYGIHVISHYNEAVSRVEGEMTKEKHLDAICDGLNSVWVPVLLAAITTVAGFISLVTSPLIPLKTFSIFSAAGVAFSLILSITFIPAALYMTPLRNVGKKRSFGISEKLAAKFKESIERARKHDAARVGGKSAKEASGNTFYAIYYFLAGTRPRLVIYIVAICLFSFIGIRHMIIDTAMVKYFPATSKFRQDVDFVDENFAGTNSLYFVISGQEKGDMTKPEILKAVDDMQAHLVNKYPQIGKAVSFTTFIKRMNQVMHAPMLDAAAEDEDFVADSGVYEEDDWGDSGDDWGAAESDDWADAGDDWGDDSDGSAGEDIAAAQKADWVDPNIEYTRKLKAQITTQKALELFARAYTAAGGSHATVEGMVEELQKELNYNGKAYYEIPYDTAKYPAVTRADLANLVSQYLLIYSGSLDRFSDDQLSPKSIRMQVQLRESGTITTRAVIEDAKAYAAKYFPEGYTLMATGNAEMEMAMTDMVIESQIMSIFISILLVFIIITLSFKSPLAGIIGAIPLTFTITLNFMVMGFTGIRLDWVTSIIASVAIGIGIDYTIHFMEAYKSERAKSSDVEEVARNAFRISGTGIVTNAVAVGLGFLVLVFSQFEILRCIGVLVAIVMFSSSLLAMTIIPGILNIHDPKFMWSKEEREQHK